MSGEDANATAERLIHENAILHIELNQTKEELKSSRALKGTSDSVAIYEKYGEMTLLAKLICE